ncbi:MAG: hypothetical protein J7599_07550 [Niabella sp.]|nr:hypothetical protein [Niabella sp.]
MEKLEKVVRETLERKRHELKMGNEVYIRSTYPAKHKWMIELDMLIKQTEAQVNILELVLQESEA